MQNLHIHSTYADGKNKPEEMVLEAIKRGFDSIGFSEHTYMHFSSYPYQLHIEDMPKYRDEVLSLKEKYKGQIDIFCGLEFEYFSLLTIISLSEASLNLTPRLIFSTFLSRISTFITCRLLTIGKINILSPHISHILPYFEYLNNKKIRM